jgi:hypothetical protein
MTVRPALFRRATLRDAFGLLYGNFGRSNKQNRFLGLRDRLELQDCPIPHVGRQVHQSIWSLSHIADPLAQLEQQRFTAAFQPPFVEDNP